MRSHSSKTNLSTASQVDIQKSSLQATYLLIMVSLRADSDFSRSSKTDQVTASQMGLQKSSLQASYLLLMSSLRAHQCRSYASSTHFTKRSTSL